MSAAIALAGLSRRFGDVVAVDGLDLQVRKGSLFALLGPNGAGKTTTIRMMLGLLPASEGTCRVMGYDAQRAGASVRASTGALLEHTGVYERLTLRENLELFGKINRMPGSRRKGRIDQVLERFGLSDRQNHRAGTLSRGMRQRLGLARAILHEPPLLLLDEPTAGLDPEETVRVREDLLKLAREGATIFLTTHDLDEVQRTCDEVAVIKSGRLIGQGTVRSLLGGVGEGVRVRLRLESAGRLADILREWDPQAWFEERTTSDGALALEVRRTRRQTSDLVAHLVNNGARIEEVGPLAASLEAAYLALVGRPSDAE